MHHFTCDFLRLTANTTTTNTTITIIITLTFTSTKPHDARMITTCKSH